MGNDFRKRSGLVEDKLNQKIELVETGEREFRAAIKGRLLLLRPGKKGLGISLAVFLLLFLFFIFGLAWPVWGLYAKAKSLKEAGVKTYDAVKAQDLPAIKAGLAQTKKELDSFTGSYRLLTWSKFIPFLGGYWRDGEHFLVAAKASLEGGEIFVAALEPYAEILGFTGADGGSEGETAQSRIEFILETIDKVSPQLDQIGEKLAFAREEVNQVNLNRYPQNIGNLAVRDNLNLAVDLINEAAVLVNDARPLFRVLPQLAGMGEEKKYLLIFQNDLELRPTGGFITAYAILRVKDGQVTPAGSYDIYSLDARFGKRIPAPEPIKNYLPLVSFWNLRDMNLSPDFVVSMDTFYEHYSSIPGTTDVDGIIAVDTDVLVRLLEVLGPVGVPEFGNFSTKPDPRCEGCPQVIYELERLADKPVGTSAVARKAVLGPLMHSVLLNALGSPRRMWPALAEVILTSLQEKHVLIYLFDEEAQKGVEAFNAAGRIVDYPGDYFHLNDANFAGAKSNLFIKQEVTQEIEIAADGTVTKTVTVDYKNPSPPSNCNLEAGELCLNGLYRDWLRLYLPRGSILTESTGSEVEVKTYEELGKTVFEAFFGDQSPLRPLGSARVTFKYRLPFKLEKGEAYRLLIQKQPGTDSPLYRLSLDGEKEELNLTTDKEIAFPH